ncbi:MAG: 50S ribosomal protein L35 [Candidatus Yanofskybacteria bacterium]|nr:50S ribosomal protein L35 [Candidatus Yanofskybacteria bacterium]
MGKTNKSFLKRIKVSGTGKIMKRPPGQNHFNARANGQQTRDKKGDVQGPHELIRKYKALIFN